LIWRGSERTTERRKGPKFPNIVVKGPKAREDIGDRHVSNGEKNRLKFGGKGLWRDRKTESRISQRGETQGNKAFIRIHWEREKNNKNMEMKRGGKK